MSMYKGKAQHLLFFLSACSAWLMAIPIGCKRGGEEEIYLPLPTRICVRTQHHEVRIPEVSVYVKFNTDTFGGYQQPLSYYDTVFVTGLDAKGCLEPIPEGRHWLVAFGVDESGFPMEVYGSLPIDISLTKRPILDTILYVSERH